MASRRSRPRIWDTDWLILRQLAAGLQRALATQVPAGSTIVDLGCGDMPYRDTVEAMGYRYRGADIVPGNDLLIGPDGRVDLADHAVDAVLSVQVLEHVPDLPAYLAEARRLMSDEGVLILSTHGTWLYHPHPEDHWRWTRTGLEKTLTQNGFRVEAMTGLVGPLATTTMIRLTGFSWVLRRLPVVGPVLAGMLAAIMNARAWAEDRITPEQLRETNACVYLVHARKARA
ncbi:class I SAM-dependent methyltransferase [Novosphingobium sp.]|uniref:class I SAM-dependent methyltransferase n=1 Tax=Novosphingobium sp. TaxID=1874826 RepID=UPI00262B5251|nr:class I SAM-dependent methyltransferase [Novosphingobium sp.]